MSRGRADRARVLAAAVTGSLANLATAERELAAELVKRLDRGQSTQALAAHVRLPVEAVEALADLHRSGHPEEPWEPPILPAILAEHQEPVKVVPADAGVYGSDFAQFVDK